MKVICAGMSKTGTKTMLVALKELGYEVYDYLENFEYFCDDWLRIWSEGGTVEDFRRMFENVDAVTDLPSAYFWDEIHKAFPDSKIILTVRDNEDTWYKSMLNQLGAANSWTFRLSCLLSPTMRKLNHFGIRNLTAVFGWVSPPVPLFGELKLNETLVRMTYRRHNAHVLQNAPKDKLLVFSVKDGWGPLCEFLGKEVPSTPFPHKNVRGNIVEELFQQNPMFIRMKREAALSFGLLSVLTAFGAYKWIMGSTPISWAQYWCSTLASLATSVGETLHII